MTDVPSVIIICHLSRLIRNLKLLLEADELQCSPCPVGPHRTVPLFVCVVPSRSLHCLPHWGWSKLVVCHAGFVVRVLINVSYISESDFTIMCRDIQRILRWLSRDVGYQCGFWSCMLEVENQIGRFDYKSCACWNLNTYWNYIAFLG